MLSVFRYLKRPEYVFRPRQVLRRLRRIGQPIPSVAGVTLPWGATVQVHPHENIGGDLYYFGIFDRIVPETIARLMDEGDWALDIGANIGQNCSLMAVKAGASGRVLGFEPHPVLFEELNANAASWPKGAPLQLERVALSNAEGEGTLCDGEEFSHNRGSATLVDNPAPAANGYRVRLARLDTFLAHAPQIGVCKIDVEGNELKVLQGAEETLRRRGIRDIVFEDFSPAPSPVAAFLGRHGFTIYALCAGWSRPRLLPLSTAYREQRGFSHNYLATLNPERAASRFHKSRWLCLKER